MWTNNNWTGVHAEERNVYIDFQTLIHSHSFDLLGAESWLTNKIFDNEILPYGYTLIGKDCGSWGGGVMLAI